MSAFRLLNYVPLLRRFWRSHQGLLAWQQAAEKSLNDYACLQSMWDSNLSHIPFPTLDDLNEPPYPDELLAPLDRSDVDVSGLTEDQRSWYEQGFVVKRNFFPSELLDAYAQRRAKLNKAEGWQQPNPYMHVPEMRDVCLYQPLMELMQELVGEPLGLHLALTGWVSTERNWHQDYYLNPECVKTWYAAAWIALDTIDEDCGPFQFIPGSHRWAAVSQYRLLRYLPKEQRESPEWPKYSEAILNRLMIERIEKEKIKPREFIAEKGDLLIWHSRLVHRGSQAKESGRLRKSLIPHYSGVNHRQDMPEYERHNGQVFFATNKTPLKE